MIREPTQEEWSYKIMKDRLFEKRNKERISYLESQYALGYANLCDELGIPPEDQFLYEQGVADRGDSYK